jgi:hypothetical protein
MIRIFFSGLGLLLASGFAMASVDTTPPPGGVYRLKPGIYVAKGSDCASPANAAILQYDGKGLSGAHSRACKATVRSRKGSRYTVDQSCIDAGAGPAPRSVQRQQVAVQDALTFTQTIKGRATSYAYCPVYQLPAALRR